MPAETSYDGIATLTRLIVSDAPLHEESITEDMVRVMGLRWTEVKMETAIDRNKGSAKDNSLRQIERVPAGAVFLPTFLVNLYERDDVNHLKGLFQAMELLEDDYLGGMGSRGYGRVKFEEIKLFWNSAQDYETGNVDTSRKQAINNGWQTPRELVQHFDELKNKIIPA